jgi:alkylation response protein AidB-like acyl-CoA dehydrogenase
VSSDPAALDRLVDSIRRFLADEIESLEPAFLSEPFSSLQPRLALLRQEVKRRGWWAPHLPAAHGGLGLSLSDFARVSEALGRTPLGHFLFNCQAPDVGNMELLIERGSPEQKARWLAPLAAGDIRSCFAMTEPERPGSNPIWLDTTATREGDDYVIDGRKWFVSAADGAAFTIVMAITAPDAPPHRRASQIIVPAETPGCRLVRGIPVMGHPGDGLAMHAEVVFERCRVPVANRIGDEGEGFALAQARLGPGRVHHCMRWIGIAGRAFDLMCLRAATRRLAPDAVLGDNPVVQGWIAESRADIDASRLLVLDTAGRIDRGGPRAARTEISIIKFFVANMLQRVVDRAIQVHGALGLTDDLLLAYWYRHERAARIYDGPDEVHKSAAARRILRGYRERGAPEAPRSGTA